MVYSRSWQYAMRLLLHLARMGPGEMASAAEIARVGGIPPSFASKILSRLTRKRLVRSYRGPGGGVMLARAPREISVADITDAMGEGHVVAGCFLGFKECSDEAPCAMHPVWKVMREGLRDAMLQRTLADFQGLPLEPSGREARRR